ncbi:MAG: GH25 family lysozyme [Oscillibacter sp.]
MYKIRLPKKILALALVLALGLSGTATAAFSDTEGHWAQSIISKWSEEYGIIQGYEDGTFRPDNSITRGAFAAILDRFLKYQDISGPETFSDTAGTWCEGSVLRANAAGVMLGSKGKALIGDPISRQEAVVMMARAFAIPESGSVWAYEDGASISNYAKGYVSAMAERGYLTDSTTTFRPKAHITRAESVNILNNMVNALIQETTTYSFDVDGTLMLNATEGAVFQDMIISGDLILAPGVTGPVTLTNVTVGGSIRNFSRVEPVITGTHPPEKPPVSAILPSQVYTPSPTTGQTIPYNKQQIPIYQGVEAASWTPGDFYWNGDRLAYAGGKYPTRFGIDVSAYQNRSSPNTTIDWNAVRNDGVEFVFVRAGFRGTSNGTLNKDAFVEKNIDGAMAAGLETGVYFFAQAITVEEAIEEADYVIEILKNHSINGPVAYDWEMHDSSYRVFGTSPEMATACAVAFCKRIEEAGYQAMVYGGQYVSYVKYDQGALKNYKSWYPEYKSTTSEKLYPTYYYQMDYWQFSSACAIAGIGGRVDVNLQFMR